MAKKKNANQNREQGDIIELTDVVEEQSDDASLEETIEGLEEAEETGEEPEVSPILGDESVAADESEASVSDDDLDFDALFEELDDKDDDDTEGFETEAVETTLSPEDEGEVTGGIHTPDSEEDFDALLEDLDKSEDLFSSLSEAEEEQPGEGETPGSSSRDAVSQDHGEEDIEDLPRMDEDEELEPQAPEGEDEPEVEPRPLEAEEESELEPQALDEEDDEETELEPQALDEEDDEEAELEPQTLDELDDDDDEAAELEAQLSEDEGDEEAELEPQSLDDETNTEIESVALEDEEDTGVEPEAPQGGEAIDVRDLANRLERLENAQSEQRISEEQLLGALNELPSDATFWSRIEERVQSVVESKVREYTQDMEGRIAKLQESLDNLAPDNLITRQSLEQKIREVKEELPSVQEVEEHKQKLRQELQQEMESRIPTAAARVIREEIRNLRSETKK